MALMLNVILSNYIMKSYNFNVEIIEFIMFVIHFIIEYNGTISRMILLNSYRIPNLFFLNDTNKDNNGLYLIQSKE